MVYLVIYSTSFSLLKYSFLILENLLIWMYLDLDIYLSLDLSIPVSTKGFTSTLHTTSKFWSHTDPGRLHFLSPTSLLTGVPVPVRGWV